MKTASLSLEIGILGIPCVNWCLNWSTSINPNRGFIYSIVVMCLCLCEMHVKLCMVMYNCALSLWATEQKVDLKILCCLKIFIGYPKRWKYFITDNFHKKMSNGEFFPNYGMFTIVSIKHASPIIWPLAFLTSFLQQLWKYRLRYQCWRVSSSYLIQAACYIWNISTL